MQEHAGACRSLQEPAGTCRSLQEPAGACKNLLEPAGNCYLQVPAVACTLLQFGQGEGLAAGRAYTR
eukprot:15431997-Alexandrium_andersonii.AAC.1